MYSTDFENILIMAPLGRRFKSLGQIAERAALVDCDEEGGQRGVGPKTGKGLRGGTDQGASTRVVTRRWQHQRAAGRVLGYGSRVGARLPADPIATFCAADNWREAVAACWHRLPGPNLGALGRINKAGAAGTASRP
jgi:hypothetical protein